MTHATLANVAADPAPLGAILDALAPLVAFDTQNPPRAVTETHPLFTHLRAALPGFSITIDDIGDGCVSFLAVRGRPKTLFNVHLDTVPATPAWTHNPFTLTRGDDQAIGLGACDIKGAAAILVTLAMATDAPMALLFTTDEEAGTSQCLHHFLSKEHPYERVVVGEPTGARAVSRHRGILSAAARFEGRSAHASQGAAKSAVHDAARWITGALEAFDASAPDRDIRLNFGRIEGGVKPNMVAAECLVRFGFRTPPGADAAALREAVLAAAPSAPVEVETRFVGPALPVAGEAAAAGEAEAVAFAARLGIAPSPMVDFWTEASLFAAAGYPSLVIGPGQIADAHTADERVSYAELLAAHDAYARVLADESRDG